MPSATYQSLYNAVRPLAEAAVDDFTKEAAKLKIPGKLSRLGDVFTGNLSESWARQVDHLANQNRAAARQLKDADKEIGALRRGSLMNATKDWLNTTGGRTVAGIGATGLVAAPLAYGAGHMQGSHGKTKSRNMAFGSGLATGLAAPGMVNAGVAKLQQMQLPAYNYGAPPHGQY